MITTKVETSNIPDIADPGDYEEEREKTPEYRSKLEKAYLQVIQADARADAWGKLVKMYREQRCTCSEQGVCAYCRDMKVKAI